MPECKCPKCPPCNCLDPLFLKCGVNPDTVRHYALNFVLGIQHVLAMMGSNILVPLITDLSPSIAMLSAGLCTIAFYFTTQRKVPCFLGSSFSFVTAMQTLRDQGAAEGHSHAYVLGAQQIAVIMTGVLYGIYATIVYFIGPNRVKKIFPPVIIGPVVMVIGLTLAPTTINSYIVSNYTPDANGEQPMKTYVVWVVAIATTLIILCVASLAKGIWTCFPVLFGIIGGYIISAAFQIIDYSYITDAYWILFIPDNLKTTFEFYKHLHWDWNAIAMMCPISIVTFMEHLGDVTTNSAVVGKNFFEDPGLHRTVGGDAIALVIAGLIGGPAITTYGENCGVLAITKNYNPNILALAACIAIFLGIITKIGGIITSIPGPVIGGASMIMFGIIASMGMKVLIINQVNITKTKNMMVAALIVVIGLGFNGGGVVINIEGIHISPLAICTIVGIILNAVLPDRPDEPGPNGPNQEEKKEFDEISDSELENIEGQQENNDYSESSSSSTTTTSASNSTTASSKV